MIDWSSRHAFFLQENSDLPPDVTFKIVEDDEVHDVNAHKMIMAMASPVFRKMFKQHFKEKDSKEVKVEETTRAAFQAMVDAIYNTKQLSASLEGKTVQEIFDVLNLAVQYEIPELKLGVRNILKAFPVTKDSALEVAIDAKKYARTFGEEAELLFLLCATVLKSKFSNANSVIEYITENYHSKDVVIELVVLMKNCSNCLQDECKDGRDVEENDYQVGLKVKMNRNWNWIGEVLEVNDKKVRVKQNGINECGMHDMLNNSRSGSRFIYACK